MPPVSRGDETLSLTHEDRPGEGAPVEPFLFFVLGSDRPLLPSIRHPLAKVDEIIVGRGDAPSATFETEGTLRRLSIRAPDRRMSSAHARVSRVLNGWM